MPSADLAALQRVSDAPNVKLDLYFDPKAKDFRLLMNQVVALVDVGAKRAIMIKDSRVVSLLCL